MVIQRDANNQGTFEVDGNIATHCDRIEIKLDSHNGFPATSINWTFLDSNPSNGIFHGEISAKGGWYKISIRAILNGQVIASDILEPVGVGEVFLISGQSNAEGNRTFSGATKGTSESRVITVDYTDIFLQENLLPYRFTPLIDNRKIGPYQNVPWIWAVMAENIVKTYQVPVLLFGAAVGGMGSDLWYGSSRGEDYSERFGRQVKFPGSPYGVISRTLKNYISFTGLRAILWQQGESDRLTSENDYFRNISYIINQSRYDFQENIPWIISESSRTPYVYYQVINAQRRLVQQVTNCYSGPNTDQLFGNLYRADGVHFHNQGIIRAGELWFEAIHGQNLFSKIPSVPPKPLIVPYIQCSGTNSLTVGIRESNLAPFWSNNTFNKTVTIDRGTIAAIVRDKIGIRYPFPEITIDQSYLRNPQLRISGNPAICEGDSVNLAVSDDSKVLWNTGEFGSSISVNQSGSYSFTYTNAYGCSIPSTKADVTVYSNPIVKVTAETAFACEVDSILLNASLNFKNYDWNTGETTRSIKVQNSNTYSLQVKDENGCLSDTAYYETTFLKRPPSPKVVESGFFGLETEGQLNDSLSVHWFLNDSLFTSNSNYIKANKPGVYKAQSQKEYGIGNGLVCVSDFSRLITITAFEAKDKIKLYPNPNNGTLTIETLEDYDEMFLSFHNLKGEAVLSLQLSDTSEPTRINLSSLADGNYIIEAKSKLDLIRFKLILRKSN